MPRIRENGNRLQIVVEKPTKKYQSAKIKSEFISSKQNWKKIRNIWTDLNVIFNHLINTLIHINISNLYVYWTFSFSLQEFFPSKMILRKKNKPRAKEIWIFCETIKPEWYFLLWIHKKKKIMSFHCFDETDLGIDAGK